MKNQSRIVSFNYQRGDTEPFEFVTDKFENKLSYRGKKVVKLSKGPTADNQLYTIQKWSWDYHPNLDNYVTLYPLTGNGKRTIGLQIINR